MGMPRNQNHISYMQTKFTTHPLYNHSSHSFLIFFKEITKLELIKEMQQSWPCNQLEHQ